MAKPNVRNLKVQPKLTDAEVQRIAHKLATALENDSEQIALLTLLFDHIEHTDPNDLWSAIYDIKKFLFIGTSESDSARDQFQAQAYIDRGKLLRWPSERRGTS